MYIDYTGNFPIGIEAITNLVTGAISLYEFGLKMSLKSFKNAPKITMNIAKKLARKGGHVQSARSFIRNQQNLINSTSKSLDDIAKISKNIGRGLLIADIVWSLGENLLSGDKNWLSDTVIDAGISVGIYALGCIPYVGWALAIGATILTEVFDDEIEDFKDSFADGWNEFWSFSWI